MYYARETNLAKHMCNTMTKAQIANWYVEKHNQIDRLLCYLEGKAASLSKTERIDLGLLICETFDVFPENYDELWKVRKEAQDEYNRRFMDKHKEYQDGH